MLHATSLRIPIVELEGGSLTALAGFDGHQGIGLVVAPRRWATIEDILARAVERGEPPFVLVLDSLEDPQNVGTLLRSAEAAGVHGVLFPTHRQAPLTPVRGESFGRGDRTPAALPGRRPRRRRSPTSTSAACASPAPRPTPRSRSARATCAGRWRSWSGSEGQGLGPAVRRRCDLFMRIPMRGAIGSLNAAVAGSILLFEALSQRDPDGRSTPPVPFDAPAPSRMSANPTRRHAAGGRRRRRRDAAAGATAPRRRRSGRQPAPPPRRPPAEPKAAGRPGQRPREKPTAGPAAPRRKAAKRQAKAGEAEAGQGREAGQDREAAKADEATERDREAAADEAGKPGQGRAKAAGQGASTGPRRPASRRRPAAPPSEPPAGREAEEAAHPPRLTGPRRRPYHSPAPELVLCGKALPVAPT